ncbi:MAG: ImmA/IrrE family metallo-endopeptidase [Deltaproteobacteria bacterium]|nr:ImmA/IrrE family metallo-endopeptidase [Deltaproteobacteria bacterium]
MLKAKKLFGFEPDYAVPPGETLKEVMVSLDMTQKGLAIRTGLTVQSLNRIFKGEQPITYETANKLELATGVPSGMWNNLEAQYREQLAKIKERDQLEADLGWLKTIPVRELIQRGAMEAAKDKVAQLRTVLKFYGVSSVRAWQHIWAQPAVAARRSQCFESRPRPASAWIRLGELQAQQIECRPYDKATFARAVNDMRLLTTKEPEAFVPEMVGLCSDAGVALCLVPEMKKVPWHGATKWISPSKAMILLNLRGKAEDQFWFSFFHEAGHVLNDSKKDLFINDGTSDDPREAKANAFAANLLIPIAYDSQIAALRSKAEVIRLAKELEIATGIVVGRFQYLSQKWNLFNGLKRKFLWAGSDERRQTTEGR